MRRRCRAGQVIDLVDLEVDGLNDVVGDDAESIEALEGRDIAPQARREVIEANDLVPGAEKQLAKMRAQKAGTAGNKYSLLEASAPQ